MKNLLIILLLSVGVIDGYSQDFFKPDTGKVYLLSEYELIGFRYFENGTWIPELKKKIFPPKEYEPVIINGDTAYWIEKRELKIEIPLNERKIFRKDPRKDGEGQGGNADSLEKVRRMRIGYDELPYFCKIQKTNYTDAIEFLLIEEWARYADKIFDCLIKILNNDYFKENHQNSMRYYTAKIEEIVNLINNLWGYEKVRYLAVNPKIILEND